MLMNANGLRNVAGLLPEDTTLASSITQLFPQRSMNAHSLYVDKLLPP